MTLSKSNKDPWLLQSQFLMTYSSWYVFFYNSWRKILSPRFLDLIHADWKPSDETLWVGVETSNGNSSYQVSPLTLTLTSPPTFIKYFMQIEAAWWDSNKRAIVETSRGSSFFSSLTPHPLYASDLVVAQDIGFLFVIVLFTIIWMRSSTWTIYAIWWVP